MMKRAHGLSALSLLLVTTTALFTGCQSGGDGGATCISLNDFEAATIELWPPNHKTHTLSIDDCIDVNELCEPDVRAFFTYATSDEPRNDTGDGNTEDDIANLTCDSVDLLSERKGNGDARVYNLGFRAIDDMGGTIDGVCRVIVPHDQGGKVPVDSGEAYREEAPDCEP
ncbi:hypothetical protein [Chondromyces crocatus]|uniref:Secreted protein n=1 Tax=Chondromyces crocatus TaxID=52 RepID=A0A0K1EMG9_CHOCO|nr:hypothetical protein [Chondromyces crocatus]AKT42090.1 uncharacterized protein CMC5_063130 [Chondromyces crocatus]